MAFRVKIHPLLHARLHLALAGYEHGVDAEVEFVGRHLTVIEQRFAERWDDLHITASGDEAVRWDVGHLDAVGALFVVEGRMTPGNVIELRNVRIVPDPDINR